MKLKLILFTVILIGILTACEDTSVRPSGFILATGTAYTELTKDPLTNQTLYRTVFLADEYYKTKLASAIAIAPISSLNSGTFTMSYYSADSSTMRARTDLARFDSTMTENHGQYQFYITSALTQERSYTTDTIESTPPDTVIQMTYFFSQPTSLNMHMEWARFPGATEYEVDIIDAVTRDKIFIGVQKDVSINFMDILSNDPGWFSYLFMGGFMFQEYIPEQEIFEVKSLSPPIQTGLLSFIDLMQ